MSFSKTHDLAVKVGEYQQDGKTKGRYENAGFILSDGTDKMLMLKRTFNPAGVPNPDGKDSIILSAFPVRGQDSNPAPKPAAPFDDDISF